MSKEHPTLAEAKQKLEHYCAYQERCHHEVSQKLRTLGIQNEDADKVMVYLIENNYLSEERFACAFARGKHRIKHWGKIRIQNELKFRNISNYIIDRALREITVGEYLDTFHALAQRNWESFTETNPITKRKKFCDYLLRKGFESQLVYDKVKELENNIEFKE